MRRSLAGLLVAASVLAACNQKADRAADAAAEAVDQPRKIDAAELQMCDVLQIQVSVADCERATLARQQVDRGVAALRFERRMELEKPSVVRLAIGEAPRPGPAATPVAPPPETSGADAQSTPDLPPPGSTPQPKSAAPLPPAPTPKSATAELPGETVEYQPLVGQFMSAKLTHDGSFEVTSADKEVQEVLEDGVTKWDWTVTPKRGGAHSLTVVTQVGFVDTAGQFHPLRGINPQTKSVEVHVPWWKALMAALVAAPTWIKALTAVVVAATALFTAWAGLIAATRRKKPAEEP